MDVLASRRDEPAASWSDLLTSHADIGLANYDRVGLGIPCHVKINSKEQE